METICGVPSLSPSREKAVLLISAASHLLHANEGGGPLLIGGGPSVLPSANQDRGWRSARPLTLGAYMTLGHASQLGYARSTPSAGDISLNPPLRVPPDPENFLQ